MSESHLTSLAERWLPVPGYEELYSVSDLGRVRSEKGRWGKPQILSGGHHIDGYRTVGLSRGKRLMTYCVHRLVLEAFVGPRPAGAECRHLNGRNTDNRLANLAWGMPAENAADRVRLGELPCGEQCHNAKLTAVVVLEIRRRAAVGESMAAIARAYGVNRITIRAVIRRDTWKHV